MRVLVIGAAGRAGKAVVERASAAGHQVTAFGREADQVGIPGVRVVEGDATDGRAVDEAVRGQDAVIETIGDKTPYKATTLEASVARAVIASMQRNGVRRLVATSMLGWATARPTRRSTSACSYRRSCAAPTRTGRRWSPPSRRARSTG